VSREILWSDAEQALFSAAGRFDSWTLAWRAERVPPDAMAVGGSEALLRLRSAGRLRGVPIGVIGPREAGDAERAFAKDLGRAIAGHGLQLLCGGKTGVMEAVCAGCLEAGGVPIGLIPDADWQAGNAFVSIPIATGIGVARNAIIARASFALVAVGGGYGTLSEMAFGLQFGRLVLATLNAPKVDGAILCADLGEVMERVARRFLGVD
jgi:uncharacterized protein (TIGR00725 family)